MTVSRICQRDVDLVDLDETAWAAAERMHRRAARSLVVLNAHRQPIGIVTARDLAVKVVAAEKPPRVTRVRDVMTAPVRTIRETASIPWALSLMRGSEIRHLPVVDEAGRLVGMLTLDQVLVHVADESHDLGRLSEPQSSRGETTPSE